MNYFKQKMDDYNKIFIIVLCFILFGLFFIVPLILLLYSRNLRFFYLYEGLSTSSWILFGYCVIVILISCYILNRINKEKQAKDLSDLETLIDGKIDEKTMTQKEIEALINTKLKDKTYHVTIETLPSNHSSKTQVAQNQSSTTPPDTTQPTANDQS